MKLLKQFAIILLFAFLAEAVHLIIPLPVPSAIYGILLLFCALRFGVIKKEQISECANLLISLLPLFFVPSLANLSKYYADYKSEVFAILLCVILPIIVTFAVSGKVCEVINRRKEQK